MSNSGKIIGFRVLDLLINHVIRDIPEELINTTMASMVLENKYQ